MQSRTAPAPSTTSSAPASTAADAPAFGVYIHWPFCAQKCPYCDFNSHVRFGGIDEARFLAAYLRELDHTASAHRPAHGGKHLLRRRHALAHGARDRRRDPRSHRESCGRIAPDAEITLEANPGSVEAGRFRGYAKAGVNRVSLGVQSLE